MVAGGVKRVFTLSGNHIMPVFDAALDAGIELIHVRHEAAAVHMADAWARLTGEAGVALVTGGPGHANAVAALYTAALAESPVVLLSGHAPLGQIGMAAFQEMRQADMASIVTKVAGVSAKAGEVGRDFSRALRAATMGRPGPVHLSLPTDVLEGEAQALAPDEAAATRLPPLNARPAIDFLAGGKRPLVVCGPMSMTRPGRERMAALEAASGIPVVGMESPRGMADPSLGAFAEMLSQADRVLLLAKRVDFTLKFGKAFAPDAHFILVDSDRAEVERALRALGDRLKGTAQADTFEALEALARASWPPTPAPWRDDVRAAIAYRPSGWSGEPTVQALQPLQALLDGHADSVLVCDGGEFGQWAQACLSAPHRVVNGVAGAIGVGLPFAAAARIARPDAPVVAVMGDGTFGFHPAEIDTAVRYRLPFVAVVGNDARWNAEYQIQVRDYGRARARGCELLPTRYDQVAIAFGGHGEHVTAASQVLPAARRAIASGLPSVLNVVIEGAAAPTFKR